MILILFGGEHLINFQGADNSAKELALEYFIPMIAGSIFMIINIFLRSILSGEGDNTFPMILMGIGTVTNLILDLPFIYYLGIKGAAIATVISQCLVSFMLNWFTNLGSGQIVSFFFDEIMPAKAPPFDNADIERLSKIIACIGVTLSSIEEIQIKSNS